VKIQKIISLFILTAALSFAHASQVLAGQPSFKKVFIIIFENTNFDQAAQQPFMAKLAKSGAVLTNMIAEVHPSQGNYIALTAGDDFGIHSDKNMDLNSTHIGDLLERAGKNWKVYAEAYPGNCFTGAQSGTYVRKHVPFMSFTNVTSNPARCARIVDSRQLDQDVANNALPEYSMYVPDLNNDGHDTGVEYADKWLAQAFSGRFQDANFMKDVLVVVTFDESGLLSPVNRVFTVLYGTSVQAGAVSATPYNHFSLLRTIEDTLNLGNLGRKDAVATPISGIWR
jgi:hypothetical protein